MTPQDGSAHLAGRLAAIDEENFLASKNRAATKRWSIIHNHISETRAPSLEGDSSGLCSRKEGKSTAIEKAFGAVLRAWFSGALPRSDNGEGGPALLYLMTAAVGTGNPAFLMVCERQNLRECFLTGVAEELVVGHWGPPRGCKGWWLNCRPLGGAGSTWAGPRVLRGWVASFS